MLVVLLLLVILLLLSITADDNDAGRDDKPRWKPYIEKINQWSKECDAIEDINNSNYEKEAHLRACPLCRKKLDIGIEN
jgi:hypothetical protein